MKAYEHQAAIERAIDSLASDTDIDTAEYQRVLSDIAYTASTALTASIQEHGDLT